MKRSLNVFGQRISISYCNIGEDGYAGLFVVEQNKILIDKTLDKKDRLQVELHEFFHACFHRLGLNQAKISHDAQELICDGFATALTENYRIK